MAEGPVPEIVTLTPEQRNRKLVIPFYGAPAANGTYLVCGDRISHRYKVTKIEIHFRDDTANNLEVSVYAGAHSQDNTAPVPSGTSILSNFTATPYIVGQGQTIVIDCLYIPDYHEIYLKVFFNNTNAYAITGLALVTIESITLEEAQELIEAAQFDIKTKTPNEYLKELDAKGEALFKQTKDMMSGSPAWWSYLGFAPLFIDSIQRKNYVVGSSRLGQPFNYIKTDATDQEKADAFKDWWKEAEAMIPEYTSANAMIEIASLGQFDFQRDLIDIDKQIWQVFDNMGKVSNMVFDTAWMPALQRVANRTWLPKQPTVDQFTAMFHNKLLTGGEVIDSLKFEGINEHWTNRILQSSYDYPEYDMIKEAYWRGSLALEDLQGYFERARLNPLYFDTLYKYLLWNIPPYTDLINMRVKEKISQSEFIEYLRNKGYEENWANLLWDSHFMPPTFTDFLTAMRRKKTVSLKVAGEADILHKFGEDLSGDVSVIKKLSELADYDPAYWDFFETRMYNDPTPRQARWGYEAGALTSKQVYDITRRHGFRDEDAEWFTDFTLKFQERPFITRYLNALMTAYLADVIDADELKKRVVAIPRREAIADWIIKIADVKKELASSKPKAEKVKLLSVSDLKKAYMFVKISEDEFRTRLQLLGYETLDIQLLIDIIDQEKEMVESGGKKTALSVSEMMNAFKQGLISEDDLRTDLMLRGLQLNEAQLLIDTKKAQWKIVEGGEEK